MLRPQAIAVVLFVFLLGNVAAGQQGEWPYSMDFGPYLMTTFDGRGRSDYTYKGIVVKLGDAGAVAFDTELLRLSAAWTDGWLQLRGTAYDGAHGPMPRLRGRKLVETRPRPGWSRAGDLADPRAVPFGPLPRDWGRYQGLRLHGDRVVLGYTVGDMTVEESYAVEGDPAARCIVRRLELGPSDREQTMVVLDGPDDSKMGSLEWNRALADASCLALLQWTPEVPEPVEVDVSTTTWSTLSMGPPSDQDYLDLRSGTGATICFVPAFGRPHGAAEPAPEAASPTDLALRRLQDGQAAEHDDDRRRSVWFGERTGSNESGRFHVDLQRVVDVMRINSFSWHRERSAQQYDLFGSDAEEPPALDAANPAAAGWRQLAQVRAADLGAGDMHGVSISRTGGLGRLRHLLFRVRSNSAWFSEIDVFADRFRAQVDAAPRSPVNAAAAVVTAPGAATLRVAGASVLLQVPAHRQPVHIEVLLMGGDQTRLAAFAAHLAQRAKGLAPRVSAPAKARWGAPITTRGVRGPEDGPFAVDTLTIPFENRYGSRMRVCAFDFFTDGRAAITTWNGDVWIVSGIDDGLEQLRWQRFATGLFDPLGLRIVDDVVYVHGRDGITRLLDRDGDGEADHYECFNNDVCVTRAFHEFAFDLQTDAAGNFYCSKGGPVNPGGRGFMQIAPHHGTIMRISKDGSRLDVIATGLRAPNGIGVSPHGVITSGDNEGTFIPRCRLNWFTAPGFYGGVKDTAHRQPVPDAPDLPLCWFPMEVDNSSGGQVWVPDTGFGPLGGRLLHLSYGTCSAYLVLTEEPDGVLQGGVVRLPCEFSSSAMRARFHPRTGQLYVAGFQGWQTSAAREGGFHRVRFTGQPLRLPIALRTCKRGVYLTFAAPLDAEVAADAGSYGVEIWNYSYSQNYGSPEVSILHPERKVEQGKPNRDPLAVRRAALSADGRTVFLEVEGMRPAHQMKIVYNLEDATGAAVKGEVHNTIHVLAEDPGFPHQH